MSALTALLSAVAEEIREHESRAEQLKPERDRLILKAIEAKFSRADLIAMTGLSPARIEQIRRRAARQS